MKNWLDQDIQPGDIVYRGARDGNSSTFKIGEVLNLDEAKQKARIDWIMDSSITWAVTAGTCDINSLVLIGLSKQEALQLREKKWYERIIEFEQDQRRYQYAQSMKERGPWWNRNTT